MNSFSSQTVVFSTTLLVSTTALAVPMCTQVTCTDLGYSTAVPAVCAQVLYCPLDPKYKICLDCTEVSCPTGYSTTVKSLSDCGTQVGWTFDSATIEDVTCGRCRCQPTSACKWTKENAGSAVLSADWECCDGTYSSCSIDCQAVSVPKNAHATATCTGCDQTVTTAWACDDGYRKTTDGKSCVLRACEDYRYAVADGSYETYVSAENLDELKASLCTSPDVQTSCSCTSETVETEDNRSLSCYRRNACHDYTITTDQSTLCNVALKNSSLTDKTMRWEYSGSGICPGECTCETKVGYEYCCTESYLSWSCNEHRDESGCE